MKRIVFTIVFVLSQLVLSAQPLSCTSQDISWNQLIGKDLVLYRYGALKDGYFGQWYQFTNPAKDKPVEQFVLKDASHFVWQYSLNGDFERTCKINGRELIVPQKIFGNERFCITFAKDEVVYTLGDDGITRAFYILNPNPSAEMLPQSFHAEKGFCNGELDDLLPYVTDNTYLKDFPMGRHYFNARALTPEMKKYLQEPVQPKLPDGTIQKAFDVVLYPHGKPVVSDVNQKSFSDCNFVSVLTDMAYLYPDFIQSILRQEKDGTFLVKMFDPVGNPITVAVGNQFPYKGKVSYYCCGQDGNPTWATVLEIAAIKYVEAYQMIREVSGCNAEYMTPMFTGDGRSICIQPRKLSQQDLTRVITTCLKNGIMVNGGFLQGNLPLDHHSTISDHGHTFLLPQQGGALFAIRNPWGVAPNSHIMNVMATDKAVTDVIDIRLISPGAAAKFFNPKALKPIDKSVFHQTAVFN